MAEPTEVHTAGAFDIRTIIGGLLGLYGLALLVMGLWFTDSEQKAKADGENLNLVVGIGLIVFAVLFIGWALLRPLRVPVDPAEGPNADAASPSS
jgi:uncharacterized membrane protein YidH (DUF202 family)